MMLEFFLRLSALSVLIVASIGMNPEHPPLCLGRFHLDIDEESLLIALANLEMLPHSLIHSSIAVVFIVSCGNIK